MLLRGLHSLNPETFVELRVKASDVFLCGLHPKNEAKTFLVGSETYKPK